MQLKVNPSLLVSGTLEAPTGTLEPISTSYALTSLSASYAANGGGGSSVSASYATNAGASTTAITASYGSGTFYAVAALSSSFATNALTANSATTATSATSAITASYVNASGVGPGAFVSGTFFGQGTNIFTGSYYQTGSSFISGAISASVGFFGTGTFATTATTASFAYTASNATTAINATVATFASGAGVLAYSASLAQTASYALVAQNLLGSITSASYATNAGAATTALTASFIATASSAGALAYTQANSGTFFVSQSLFISSPGGGALAATASANQFGQTLAALAMQPLISSSLGIWIVANPQQTAPIAKISGSYSSFFINPNGTISQPVICDLIQNGPSVGQGANANQGTIFFSDASNSTYLQFNYVNGFTFVGNNANILSGKSGSLSLYGNATIVGNAVHPTTGSYVELYDAYTASGSLLQFISGALNTTASQALNALTASYGVTSISASYALTATTVNGQVTMSSINISSSDIPAFNQITAFTPVPINNYFNFIDPGTGSNTVMNLPTGSTGMVYYFQNVTTGTFDIFVNSASTTLGIIQPGGWGEFVWTSAGIWRGISASNMAFSLQQHSVSNAGYTITTFPPINVVSYDALAGSQTVVLPPASASQTPVYIIDNEGVASTTHGINLAPHGSDTIAGSTSTVGIINQPYGIAIAISDQTSNWVVISPSVDRLNTQTVGGNKNWIGAVTSFTSSVNITGSLNVTASVNVFGPVTSSVGFSGLITSASYALTASYALAGGSGGSGVSSSYALTASYASVAQNVLGSITSASYALTASYALAGGSGGSSVSSSYATTSSYASVAQYLLGSVTSASYAATCSYQNPILQTVTFTTPSITPGAFYSTSLQITTPYYTLIVLSSSVNSRLCAYINTQSMVNDQTRSFTQQPSASTGVLLDVVFTGSFGRNVPLSPVVTGYNYEGTPLTVIPVNITNLEPTAQTVTVTVAYTTF